MIARTRTTHIEAGFSNAGAETASAKPAFGDAFRVRP
jgi:hypothetical protein